jgi:hypothetical protein
VKWVPRDLPDLRAKSVPRDQPAYFQQTLFMYIRKPNRLF